jgi:hypothetical protein
MPVQNPYRAAVRPGHGWRAMGAAALAVSAALAKALTFDVVPVGSFERLTQRGARAGQVELRALP